MPPQKSLAYFVNRSRFGSYPPHPLSSSLNVELSSAHPDWWLDPLQLSSVDGTAIQPRGTEAEHPCSTVWCLPWAPSREGERSGEEDNENTKAQLGPPACSCLILPQNGGIPDTGGGGSVTRLCRECGLGAGIMMMCCVLAPPQVPWEPMIDKGRNIPLAWRGLPDCSPFHCRMQPCPLGPAASLLERIGL